MRPNDLWCIDFKGQFKKQDNKLCIKLTITDQVSRFLITTRGHEAISSQETIEDCKIAFRKYSIPKLFVVIMVPFSSRTIWGLVTLIFWLRLGIKLERTRPGKPQENGRHERMHRTLKLETAKPSKENIIQQQDSFDKFKEVYNNKKP